MAAYGERSHFILPDGTEAWLNSGSSIVYEKNFTGATRSIFLRGEAHFSVAHDASKPFVVKTECIDVTALGTTFNVQSYPDAMKIIATLESGKIKIQSGQNELHSTVILYPNEQLTYDRGTNEFVTRKVDASRNTRWTHGFTIFQGNTVDEVVGTLERRFKISVRYDAARFAGRTFTVRFSPDEDVREVFDILKVIIGFQYRTEGSVIHII